MPLPDRERSWAVLIGVGAYQHQPPLRGVHSGAKALREALTDARYGSLKPEHCLLVPEGAGRDDVFRAVGQASQQAKDMLLFYFAGHGLHGRRRYDLNLALAGTRSEDVTITGIKFDDLRDVVLDSKAKSKVMILDCCLSGRATAQRMSGDFDFLDEVEIEGVATLASVPPNEPSIILDGEAYPAYTGRLLRFMQNGIPNGPELLNLAVLHRSLRVALKAAGLRQPEASLDALVGDLGLVRNRAHATPSREQPKKPDPPVKPTEPARLFESLESSDRTRPVRRAPSPRAAVPAPDRTHQKPAVPVHPVRSRSPVNLGFAVATALFFGALSAYVLVALYHDLVSEHATDDFGDGAGTIATGVVLIACVGLFVLLTQSGLVRVKVSVVAFLASFFVGLGTMLAFGLGFQQLAVGALCVGGYIAFVSVLRWYLTRR